MIIVLAHGYKAGDDDILDVLHQVRVFADIPDVAMETGLKVVTLNRKLKQLRDTGKLISYRYQGNNIIWLIGKDAEEKWNKWEAKQIAVHRQYPDIHTSLSEEEIELISPFENDVKKMLFFGKINKLLNADAIEISDELHEYVDKLWRKL